MTYVNAFLVLGSDMVGQVYFVKASWPKCVDCDGWAIGLSIANHGLKTEGEPEPVCAVDGFHRAADGYHIRRFEDEDLQTRRRYG